MPIPETTHPACAANEARVRASGINLTNDYGKWVLQMAMTSKAPLCLARKDFDFLCVQPGDGAGHRCQLHGGASRCPKTEEGRARAAGNLRQNRMRGPIHWRSEEPGDVVSRPAPAVPEAQALGEYLSQAELVTLTGKKRGGAPIVSPCRACWCSRPCRAPSHPAGHGARHPVDAQVLGAAGLMPQQLPGPIRATDLGREVLESLSKE